MFKLVSIESILRHVDVHKRPADAQKPDSSFVKRRAVSFFAGKDGGAYCQKSPIVEMAFHLPNHLSAF